MRISKDSDSNEKELPLSDFVELMNEVDAVACAVANSVAKVDTFNLSHTVKIRNETIWVTRRVYQYFKHSLDVLKSSKSFSTVNDMLELDIVSLRQLFILLKRELIDNNS